MTFDSMTGYNVTSLFDSPWGYNVAILSGTPGARLATVKTAMHSNYQHADGIELPYKSKLRTLIFKTINIKQIS